ncbi:MAG TPA: TetR/AcrR family transcriptional regulator [Acidimicrobiales bacterium]|nr:TetR/AcrR family transcriptional regulator [Acidimicrobiales bacterium]
MPAAARPRRTQEERRAQTRTALLDATVDCLVDLGFASTTTTEVTRRAGVSVGALLHHFPSKADLLTAAVAHVLDRRQDEFRKSMANLDPGADRVDAAIDLLWSSFSGPTFVAWLELWVAARTDPELAEVVAAVDEDFVRTSKELYRELFPPEEYPRVGLDTLPFVFAVMDGAALQRLVPHGEDADAVIDILKTLARLAFLREPGGQEAE